MIAQGIPLESDYPYNSNMKYSGICSAKNREKLEGNVPYSENLYEIADLERAIVQWGPAVARIAGGNLFFQGVGPSG